MGERPSGPTACLSHSVYDAIATPVSYVAPARELSILVGAVAGVTVLEEGHPRRRTLAAAAIFVGIVALAVG